MGALLLLQLLPPGWPGRAALRGVGLGLGLRGRAVAGIVIVEVILLC